MKFNVNHLTKKDWTKAALAMSVVAAMALLPEMAHALPAPAAVDAAGNPTFLYDVYDIGVNKILKGPVGFIAGVAIIGFGALQMMKAWPVALLGLMGGSAMIKADTIVASLGMLV